MRETSPKSQQKEEKNQKQIELALMAIRTLNISAESVSEIYRENRRKYNTKAPYFATLVALSSGKGEAFENDLYTRVIQQAIRFKYFDPLLAALVKPTSDTIDPYQKERNQITKALTGNKLLSDHLIHHQSMIVAYQLTASASNFSRWIENGRATAVVKSGANYIGTGFLVGPDLVLTAYHVAFSEEGSQKPDLQFCFVGVDKKQHVETPVITIKDMAIATSRSHQQTMNNTIQVDESANSQLDYALLRLPQPLRGCDPVEYARSQQKADKYLALMTFACSGAETLLFGRENGLTTTRYGYRIGHRINTKDGFSGAPVFDSFGQVIGLHEAGWKARANELQFFLRRSKRQNRAVDIAAIFDDIRKKHGSDILAPREKTIPPAVNENKWREAWAWRGYQLAGTQQDAWRKAIIDLGDPDPGIGKSPDKNHYPVFPRTNLEEWVKDALLDDAQTPNRLLVIERKQGQRGAGLSFTPKLVAFLLDNPKAQLVTLTASNRPDPWCQALDRDRHTFGDNRPGDGHIRYEILENVINSDIEALPATERVRRRIIMMDLTGVVDPFDQSLWLALASKIFRRNNHRVILIDPPITDEEAFSRQFFNPQDDEARRSIKRMSFNHVDWQEIEETVLKIDPESDWQKPQLDRLKAQWESGQRLYRTVEHLKTVEAVAFVINRQNISKATS